MKMHPSSLWWSRASGWHGQEKASLFFDMEVGFDVVTEGQTIISFTMMFGTAEECEKMIKFVVPKNEENFDRLERVLVKMQEREDSK